MKILLPYIKKYKKSVIFSILFMLLDVLCEVIQPTLMAAIVGYGISTGNVPYILLIGFLMVTVAGVAIFAGYKNSIHSATAGVGITSEIRAGLFSKVQSFSFKNIDTFSTASLTTRLTNDITLLQHTAIMALRILVRSPLMFTFALIMAIRINLKLSIILAVIIPLLLVLIFLILRKALPLFTKMQKSLDNLNSIVRENLTNVRVVKSFVRQDFEKEKFRHSNDNLTNTSLNAMNLVIFNMPILMFIMNAAIVSVVWFGGNQIINNELDVASMTAFISYIIQILISLMMFSMMFVMLSRAVASYNRVKEVLNTEIDLKDRKNAVKADKFKGDVSFKNVCFKYDKTHDKYILKDINFSVKSGSLTAIIGSTGSGKTSLVQLIPRLYEPSKGKILIDNKDIQKFTLNSLRQNIGVVLQKNTLFSGTIRDNLRWGDIGATDEEIVETAKYVQAHDFITNLPNGYDTWVEQGGVNLSGGQKQRLCIARAILKKPSILILDDSTSAIDTATEAKILDAFKSKLKGVTTFIIAQRISSIISADKIILLDDGKIIATGNHAELLKTCPEYQEIYYSQNSSSEKEAVLND